MWWEKLNQLKSGDGKRSWTVRQQLTAGFGVVVCIVVTLVVVNQVLLSRLDSTLDDLKKESVPAGLLLLNVDRDSYQAQIALERVVTDLAEDRDAELDDFTSNAAQTGERLQEFQSHMLGLDGEQEMFSTILELRDAWLVSADTALRAFGTPEAIDRLVDSRAAFGAYRDSLDGMSGLYETKTAELSQASDDQRSSMAMINWFVLLVAVAASLAIARFVVRRVSNDVRRSITAMHDASLALGDLASGITNRAANTVDRAAAARGTADEVSAGVLGVTTAVEQLSASISEIAGKSAEANSVALEAVQLAEEARALIEQLGASSNEIGTVVASIRDIAEQTNLLALNATIEAARAGAAGRGFSVVAAEVKELSNETARATGEISDRIATIQRDTLAAVDANESVNAIISRIAELQQTIAVAVEEQSAVTAQIAEGAGAAASGSRGIAETVSAVADNAGETRAAGEETGRSAEELTKMADELGALVGSDS